MRRMVLVPLVALLAVVFLNACSRKSETEGELMQAGLDALYQKHDPNGAVAAFRKVLDKNPTHYGATYQLATALDRAGKRDDATPYWEKILTTAEKVRDEKTAATARARLGRFEPVDEEGQWMKAGLDALYTKKDPNAAADLFRKVLGKRPGHYGATYQLATALDRAGKPTEARGLWEKVLKMAEESKDTKTADTARTRLARR